MQYLPFQRVHGIGIFASTHIWVECGCVFRRLLMEGLTVVGKGGIIYLKNRWLDKIGQGMTGQ